MPVLDLSQAGFDVQQAIGTAFGGAGHVFTARSKVHGRVACKVFAVDLLTNSNYEFSHIVDEVHWLKWIRHRHVVGFSAACVLGRHLCIAMPLSDMGSALYVMEKYYNSGIPEMAIALILRHLLDALEYLHSQNIIHRSIRAGHLLLDSTGGVRLSGFRHSLRLEDGAKKSTDFTDHLVDSLLWLAPEVLAQDVSGYGTASDMYSVGITLCEMANGFPPFSDMQNLQMLYEKQRGTTPRLLDCTTLMEDDESEHRLRRFTDFFHNVTDACLKPQPQNRPTIAELKQAPFLKKARRGVNLNTLLPLARPIPDVTQKGIVTLSTALPSNSEIEWNFSC